MRFAEIGQQLRAYRLESGLRAEEIAARLGVSRAALYRYEKGEVIKLDTIKRLAELLKISPLSLLGIGIEYVTRPVAFAERLRQIEETADQLLLVGGTLFDLSTSDSFDATLAEGYAEAAELAGVDRAAARTQSETLLGILGTRKRLFQSRRPSITAVFDPVRLARFAADGILATPGMSERISVLARQAARREAESIAAIMDSEPIGLQFGLLQGPAPSGAFLLARARERAHLVVAPLPLSTPPSLPAGVAMITSADEAIAAHQRAAEAYWRDALKGPAAATRLREIVRDAG